MFRLFVFIKVFLAYLNRYNTWDRYDETKEAASIEA
jgi:hypothetical protein